MTSAPPPGNRTVRVLAETAYPISTPAARVRVAAFAPFLREHGIELELFSTLTEPEYAIIASRAPIASKIAALTRAAARTALRSRPPHDLLLVQRLRFLSPLPGIDPPRRLDAYDFDDALFLPAEGAINSRFRWAKREPDRFLQYVRRARLTIAGNAFLAERARRLARRVEVVPTCVDPARQPVRVHRDEDPPTVGWIGSASTSPYLRQVLPVFERLNRGRPRVKVLLVGADPAIQAPWIEHRTWSLATEADELASFDIGIMPLPDNDWARGKCGYKVLQYFAAGVPAVASPVGVARELVGDDRGLLARSTDEWQSAIEALLSDADDRRQRGAAARAFVEANYSYQRWAPALASMLLSLTD